MYISNGNTYRLLLHNNYLTGAIPKMAYGYGGFTFTLDNNCQLTSAFPAAVVTSQLHCKPGTAGQRAPSMLPSTSPTPCKLFTLHLTLPFQISSHHYLFTTQCYFINKHLLTFVIFDLWFLTAPTVLPGLPYVQETFSVVPYCVACYSCLWSIILAFTHLPITSLYLFFFCFISFCLH